MSEPLPTPVDHHQFVVGAATAETYEPSESGSVLEVGQNFVTVRTGIAYGPVWLTVTVLDNAPPDDADWEVVEEADVQITKAVHVLGLDGTHTPGFDRVPVRRGRYRCRVSGRGRDQHWDLEVSQPSESYLVQFWKVARPTPMVRLRKTDNVHDEGIVTHPGRNWWDPDPAADATIAVRYGYEYVAEQAKKQARRWGGRPPTDKISGLNHAEEFAYLDRALVDAIARARVTKLRTIAVWAAEYACTATGAARADWVQTALAALPDGGPLPEPFDAPDLHFRIIDALGGDQLAASGVWAIRRALHPEPLRAVFDTLGSAARALDNDHATLIADLRAQFFPKLMPAEEYERWI
ncbi:transposase [Nocardia sp. NPDC058705]|uniref:transposase n=1 Tax=Nocardia sp. NPDC058705 TaxID=3346609 RepID=UPI0036B58E85